MKNRFTTLTIVNLLAFIATLTINYLSNSLPLNGKNPAQLSDDYPNLFVPAGLTFAIWGLIYSLMFGWIGGQVIGLFSPKQRASVSPNLERIQWLFLATCVFNIGWLFAWHWLQVGLSVLAMIGLLVSLITLNERIQNGRAKVNDFEKRMAHPLFGIYQGWITVALIANVTALLVHSGWQGFGFSQAFWASLMIAVGASLAMYMVWSRNQIFHGLVVAWAFLGIFIKRNALGDAALVQNMALVGMVAVLLVVVLRFRRWWAY